MSGSFSARNLPVELLLRIIRTVVSKEDLCQLRSVNSTFNKLATRVIFGNTTVSNNYKSADRLWTVLHTPHIAQHVQSLTYVEEQIVTDDLWGRRAVRKRLEAAFALLHHAPELKALELFYKHSVLDYDTYGGMINVEIYSHQLDIIAALGRNQNPLPRLQSLTIHQWLGNRKYDSLYDEAPIAQLVMSLRHLSFSVADIANANVFEPRMRFWKPVVVQCVLQRAMRLESLAIDGNGISRSDRTWDDPCLDVSKLAGYPRLASLSLKGVLWEDGEIGDQGVVEPPAVERFIARHGKTLKKLKLHNCMIAISPGRTTPVCYWADIYNRLAEALTELVELEVEFHFNKFDKFTTQYAVLRHLSEPMPCKTLDGTERDGVSLEEFMIKAAVNNSAYSRMGADSMPQL